MPRPVCRLPTCGPAGHIPASCGGVIARGAKGVAKGPHLHDRSHFSQDGLCNPPAVIRQLDASGVEEMGSGKIVLDSTCTSGIEQIRTILTFGQIVTAIHKFTESESP